MAAVSVVLPWSMWPIVPTLTCGFLRSNFCLAICPATPWSRAGPPRVRHGGRPPPSPACAASSPPAPLAVGILPPRPGPGEPRRALLSACPGDDLPRDRLGHLVVGVELHREI